MSDVNTLTSEIDVALKFYYECGKYQSANKARAELTAIRARAEQAERERDEARARVAELEAAEDDDDHYSEPMMYQCEKCGCYMIQDVIGNSGDPNLDFGPTYCPACEVLKLREQLAQPATLMPRRCWTCAQEAAKAMREAAARLVVDYAIDMLSTDGDELDAVIERDDQIADAIRALPLPSCDGCNPLKPEAADAANSLEYDSEAAHE